MPSPARISSSSSSLTPVSLGLAAALKIAQEACNDVPIARQILGSAVCIVELAHRFEKNKDSIRALADRSALLAQRIAQVATVRALDECLLQRLDNLQQVFLRIEAFLEKESAVSGRTQRIVRTLFVTPRIVEQLAAELQNEIEAFVLTAAVDLAHNHARYDGGFRILRDADVHKLDVITDVQTPDALVVYAKARVDNEIMVVTYAIPRKQEAYAEAARENVERSRTLRKRHDELLLRASTVFGSHPHVAQFYGRGISGSNGEFRVLRGEVQFAYDYMRQLVKKSPGRGVRTACEIHWKLIDATRYLNAELEIDWYPADHNTCHITVNAEGEPIIGLMEQFADARQVVWTGFKFSFLEAFLWNAGIIRIFSERVDPKEVADNWIALVPHWTDERLVAVSSLLATLAMTEGYYAKYRRMDLPLWDGPLEIPPDRLERIYAWYDNEQQAAGEQRDFVRRDFRGSTGYPPSARARCLSAVIDNVALPDGSYWSWDCSCSGGQGARINFYRAWTCSEDGGRSWDHYLLHIPPSHVELFGSAMGESFGHDYVQFTLYSSWEDIRIVDEQ